MRRLNLFLAFICFFYSLGALAQLDNEKISFRNRKVVAKGDRQFAPFEFVNKNGEPDGFSVELFRAAMKRLGIDYTLALDDWGKVQGELDAKQIDLVVGMVYSKERAARVKFGVPHCMISYNIVCRKDCDFASLKELRGKSIIVQDKDRAHEYLLSSGLTDKIVAVEDIADAVELLASGQHDAVLSFDRSSFYFIGKGGYTNLLVHLTDIPAERYSVAVNTDNGELLYMLNAAIYQMKIDGEYDRIYYKWFGAYEEPKVNTVVWVVLGALGFCVVIFGVFICLLKLKVRQAIKELGDKNKKMSLLVEELRAENKMRLDVEKNLLEAKERAEESERLKSAFLANISHEIRTPLNAIVGFSSILCDMEFESDRNKHLDIILKNNELLLQLINDLLDLSNMESGELLIDYDYFQLSDACEQALASVNQNVKRQNVQLLCDIAFDCTLYSDRSRVVQVLMNFLNNAFKFTDSGTITICTKRLEDDVVEIAVVDTGIGIGEEKRQQIFERFVKLNVFSQGTGLGLSICKKIIEKLHGQIGVETKEGEGSKFWIKLPIIRWE